ncbi:hypothetical protein D3C81_1011500 [compost metagenome]
MQTTPINQVELSPLFQEQHAKFVAARSAYQESQETYQATVRETARLEQAAQALEAEAEQANNSWKEMAKARHADQRKINQEVERSVQLKMEAEKYRRTAGVREELHGEIVVQMAKARADVSTHVTALRDLYCDERIAALLATEGLPELLRELRDLAGDDFKRHLDKTADQAEPIASPVLDEIHAPKIIPDEIVPKNGMEMRRLEISGGKTTSHAAHQ